jgi:high-affinity iron transporter
VGVGLVVSLILAFAFQVLISQFESERYRNLLMIGILLFASGVLSYMSIWMQRQSGARVSAVRSQLEAHVGARNVIGMCLLASVAVLREGFETVLFFSALSYAESESMTLQSGVAGGLLGLASSIALVWVLMRGTRKLALGPFFKYTGLLLIVIAAGLFSSAVNLMQTVGWLPPGNALFDISFILDDRTGIGLFLRALLGYNAAPNLLQFLSWTLFLGTFLFFWRRTYAPARA